MSNEKKEKPRHLGRGLASLLGPITLDAPDISPPAAVVTMGPNFPPDKELRNSLREITIDSISPNPYQPRMVWEQQELADLAESIKSNGIVQPIIVRPAGAGYQLIAGERRLRAAQMVSL
jgi:hypothetical protein